MIIVYVLFILSTHTLMTSQNMISDQNENAFVLSKQDPRFKQGRQKKTDLAFKDNESIQLLIGWSTFNDGSIHSQINNKISIERPRFKPVHLKTSLHVLSAGLNQHYLVLLSDKQELRMKESGSSQLINKNKEKNISVYKHKNYDNFQLIEQHKININDDNLIKISIYNEFLRVTLDVGKLAVYIGQEQIVVPDTLGINLEKTSISPARKPEDSDGDNDPKIILPDSNIAAAIQAKVTKEDAEVPVNSNTLPKPNTPSQPKALWKQCLVFGAVVLIGFIIGRLVVYPRYFPQR